MQHFWVWYCLYLQRLNIFCFVLAKVNFFLFTLEGFPVKASWRTNRLRHCLQTSLNGWRNMAWLGKLSPLKKKIIQVNIRVWMALRLWDNALDGTWVALKLMQRLTKMLIWKNRSIIKLSTLKPNNFSQVFWSNYLFIRRTLKQEKKNKDNINVPLETFYISLTGYK